MAVKTDSGKQASSLQEFSDDIKPIEAYRLMLDSARAELTKKYGASNEEFLVTQFNKVE